MPVNPLGNHFRFSLFSAIQALRKNNGLTNSAASQGTLGCEIPRFPRYTRAARACSSGVTNPRIRKVGTFSSRVEGMTYGVYSLLQLNTVSKFLCFSILAMNAASSLRHRVMPDPSFRASIRIKPRLPVTSAAALNA
ncbi:hypothetical protein D3C81_1346170 [compost metagenome]